MIKEKIKRNEYMEVQRKLADEYMKKCIALNGLSDSEIKERKSLYYKEFESELEKFELLNFDLDIEDKDLARFINNNFDYEEKGDGYTKFTGNGAQGRIYNFAQKNNYVAIHNDYYCCCYYSPKSLSILTYCEGDLVCQVFDSKDKFLSELNETVDFYKNEY